MAGTRDVKPLPASFRDPSGYVFRAADGTVRRFIGHQVAKDYQQLEKSGLYQALVTAGLLIPHAETKDKVRGAYKVIKPEMLSFVSYPYEWSFSQLKDAALATLEIQRLALEHGMTLKDASAYNIQFHQGRPVLIDTLSFTKYEEGSPWVAYRQFCQHFLAPLALAAKTDVRLSQLLRIYIDGVPLDLAAKLLPKSSRWKPGLGLHLFLHARSQQKYDDAPDRKPKQARKINLKAIVSSLQSTVGKLDWQPGGTEWGEYYTFTNYNDKSFREKGELVGRMTKKVKPQTVWDLGGNTGAFSRIASDAGIPTISWDIDPAAVEKNYLEMKRRQENNLLPLVLDLTNPSPGLGWQNQERDSVFERGPADLVYFLAMIHHMAIGNNVPLESVAAMLAAAGKHAIVEFVPKGDSKVDHMLTSREDIFDRYTQPDWEADLKKYFTIVQAVPVKGSKRTMYLLKRK